jgi:hypothetical protein
MSEIKFEIIKKIGVLSKSDSGWAKQLNLISWNERDPKYDIREWSPDGTGWARERRGNSPPIVPPFRKPEIGGRGGLL